MKAKIVLIMVCAIFSFCMIQDTFAQKSKGKETVTFYVEEMECKNCQAKVEKNIAFEKGITDIKCDLKTRTVEITYKTDKTSPDNIAKGFEKIGMEAVIADSILVVNENEK